MTAARTQRGGMLISYLQREREFWSLVVEGAMASQEDARKHIAIMPFPTAGRIVPLMVLAKKFATQGFLVSFIFFPANRRPQIEDAYATRAGKHPLIQLILLQVISSNSGSHISDDKSAHSSNRLHDTLTTVGPLYETLEDASVTVALDNLLNQLQPSCIIYCELLFTFQSSSNIKIPRCVFFAMPATILSLLFAQDMEKAPLTPQTINLNVPCLGTYPVQGGNFDMISILTCGKQTFYNLCIPKLHEASAIFINSFPQAEPKAFQALNSLELNPNQVDIVSIGPLLPEEFFSSKTQQQQQQQLVPNLSEEIESFLSKQLPKSVVYISFGSLGVPSSEQLHAIANGLEGCHKPFLWIVNSETNIHQLLPEGFTERSSEFGMVTSSWVPQLSILSHPAIGVFFTHCGWNSSIEAISAGTPVLTKPYMIDQYTNAWTLVDQLGMGVEVSKDGMSLDCKQIEEGIRLILEDSEQGKSIRNRALLAKAAATEAWTSSANNLEIFIDRLTSSSSMSCHK